MVVSRPGNPAELQISYPPKTMSCKEIKRIAMEKVKTSKLADDCCVMIRKELACINLKVASVDNIQRFFGTREGK